MPHQRFPAPGAPPPPGGAVCMALRTGDRIVLGGQTGMAAAGLSPGDAAGQAEQAMQAVRVLLEQAGSRMEHIRKLTTYVTDRAWREPVAAVIARHLGSLDPARTELIVSGLATPEMLVAIDVDAIVPPG